MHTGRSCSRSFKFIIRCFTNNKYFLVIRSLACALARLRPDAKWVWAEWEKHSLGLQKRRHRQMQQQWKKNHLHNDRKLKTEKKKNNHKEWPARDFSRSQNSHIVLLSSSRCESLSLCLYRSMCAKYKKKNETKPNRPTKIYVESNLSDNECHKILKRLIESCKKISSLCSPSPAVFMLFVCLFSSISRNKQNCFCSTANKNRLTYSLWNVIINSLA